jgi:DNA-binding transcriptional LysR family regulator
MRIAVLREAAIKGRGVALLPTFIAAASLRDGTLQRVLVDYKAPPWRCMRSIRQRAILP